MKALYTLFICILSIYFTNAQDKYLTKNGSITFFSEAPIENITADNNQVLSIVDATNGNIAISILMKSFMFKKALMQEHFNENYVESDVYPKATFKGKIINFVAIKDLESKVKVKGSIKIHGVSKELEINANVLKTSKEIKIYGWFFINILDFNIKIPKILEKNIAKQIKITFQLNHTPYKK